MEQNVTSRKNVQCRRTDHELDMLEIDSYKISSKILSLFTEQSHYYIFYSLPIIEVNTEGNFS